MTTPNNPGGEGYGNNESFGQSNEGFGNYGQWNDPNQNSGQQQSWQDPNMAGEQHYGQMPNYSAPAAANGDDGFFKALFDLEFNHFVTIKFVKIIYLIFMILIGSSAASGVIVFIILAVRIASEGEPVAAFFVFLLGLIAVVVFSLFYLITMRVSLEFYVAGIRTAQNTGDTRDAVRELQG